MTHKQHRLSRREFLKRTATISLGTMTAGTRSPAVGQAQQAAPIPPHGAELRGMRLPVQDPLAEGRFGFLLKKLPAAAPRADPASPDPVWNSPWRELGRRMEEQFRDPSAVDDDDNDRVNENPNPDMTSGVTFLGQFIDHDITFDTTPLRDQLADPDAITSFRTPRYDLDSLYGRGPTDDPQLYDPQDPAKLLLVTNQYGVDDLPRTADGKAIIADPRNDQTMIIAQLHIAFVKFHNQLVDKCRAEGVPTASVFESARQLARWHYQWLVIHDFLPRFVDKTLVDAVYQDVAGKPPQIKLAYYKPTNKHQRAFIPLEFSVAAYRFGHSIVRPRYTISSTISKVPLFSDDPTVAYENKLNGSRPIPARLRIQWSRFFNAGGVPTAKRTRQIDARLAGPLFTLPATALPDANPEGLLAVRNLLRGRWLQLASGQAVARRLHVTPLTNDELAMQHRVTLNKDTFEVVYEDQVPVYDENLGPIITHPVWNGEAPLWFYILKEAELLGKTRRLGPVGGRIVTETLVGLLQRDRNSYLYVNPAWKPGPPIAPTTGRFTMVDLLTYAGVWT